MRLALVRYNILSGMMDGMGEYAEAGGPGGLSGHPHHPSMSSAMNSTLSRIDQLMRDQERQYMTLPPLQNPAVNNVKVRCCQINICTIDTDGSDYA